MYLMTGALRPNPINQSTNHYVRLHRSKYKRRRHDRRGFLKCMAWAGTGGIWSINGGLLTSTVLGQEANNQSAIATAELNFVQISDSHIGFNNPANTDVVGTFRETIMHITRYRRYPSSCCTPAI